MINSRNKQENGFVSIEFIVAVGFSLVMLVLLVNFIVFQFGEGMLRAAVNEGARAGARADGTEGSCSAKIEQVLGSDFLDGALFTSRPKISCPSDADTQRAVIKAQFAGWFPEVGAIDVEVKARAVKETRFAP